MGKYEPSYCHHHSDRVKPVKASSPNNCEKKHLVATCSQIWSQLLNCKSKAKCGNCVCFHGCCCLSPSHPATWTETTVDLTLCRMTGVCVPLNYLVFLFSRCGRYLFRFQAFGVVKESGALQVKDEMTKPDFAAPLLLEAAPSILGGLLGFHLLTHCYVTCLPVQPPGPSWPPPVLLNSCWFREAARLRNKMVLAGGLCMSLQLAKCFEIQS